MANTKRGSTGFGGGTITGGYVAGQGIVAGTSGYVSASYTGTATPSGGGGGGGVTPSTEVKYYQTPAGTVTYRAGGVQPPTGSIEISKQQYSGHTSADVRKTWYVGVKGETIAGKQPEAMYVGREVSPTGFKGEWKPLQKGGEQIFGVKEQPKGFYPTFFVKESAKGTQAFMEPQQLTPFEERVGQIKEEQLQKRVLETGRRVGLEITPAQEGWSVISTQRTTPTKQESYSMSDQLITPPPKITIDYSKIKLTIPEESLKQLVQPKTRTQMPNLFAEPPPKKNIITNFANFIKKQKQIESSYYPILKGGTKIGQKQWIEQEQKAKEYITGKLGQQLLIEEVMPEIEKREARRERLSKLQFMNLAEDEKVQREFRKLWVEEYFEPTTKIPGLRLIQEVTGKVGLGLQAESIIARKQYEKASKWWGWGGKAVDVGGRVGVTFFGTIFSSVSHPIGTAKSFAPYVVADIIFPGAGIPLYIGGKSAVQSQLGLKTEAESLYESFATKPFETTAEFFAYGAIAKGTGTIGRMLGIQNPFKSPIVELIFPEQLGEPYTPGFFEIITRKERIRLSADQARQLTRGDIEGGRIMDRINKMLGEPPKLKWAIEAISKENIVRVQLFDYVSTKGKGLVISGGVRKSLESYWRDSAIKLETTYPKLFESVRLRKNALSTGADIDLEIVRTAISKWVDIDLGKTMKMEGVTKDLAIRQSVLDLQGQGSRLLNKKRLTEIRDVLKNYEIDAKKLDITNLQYNGLKTLAETGKVSLKGGLEWEYIKVAMKEAPVGKDIFKLSPEQYAKHLAKIGEIEYKIGFEDWMKKGPSVRGTYFPKEEGLPPLIAIRKGITELEKQRAISHELIHKTTFDIFPEGFVWKFEKYLPYEVRPTEILAYAFESPFKTYKVSIPSTKRLISLETFEKIKAPKEKLQAKDIDVAFNDMMGFKKYGIDVYKKLGLDKGELLMRKITSVKKGAVETPEPVIGGYEELFTGRTFIESPTIRMTGKIFEEGKFVEMPSTEFGIPQKMPPVKFEYYKISNGVGKNILELINIAKESGFKGLINRIKYPKEKISITFEGTKVKLPFENIKKYQVLDTLEIIGGFRKIQKGTGKGAELFEVGLLKEKYRGKVKIKNEALERASQIGKETGLLTLQVEGRYVIGKPKLTVKGEFMEDIGKVPIIETKVAETMPIWELPSFFKKQPIKIEGTLAKGEAPIVSFGRTRLAKIIRGATSEEALVKDTGRAIADVMGFQNKFKEVSPKKGGEYSKAQFELFKQKIGQEEGTVYDPLSFQTDLGLQMRKFTNRLLGYTDTNIINIFTRETAPYKETLMKQVTGTQTIKLSPRVSSFSKERLMGLAKRYVTGKTTSGVVREQAIKGIMSELDKTLKSDNIKRSIAEKKLTQAYSKVRDIIDKEATVRMRALQKEIESGKFEKRVKEYETYREVRGGLSKALYPKYQYPTEYVPISPILSYPKIVEYPSTKTYQSYVNKYVSYPSYPKYIVGKQYPSYPKLKEKYPSITKYGTPKTIYPSYVKYPKQPKVITPTYPKYIKYITYPKYGKYTTYPKYPPYTITPPLPPIIKIEELEGMTKGLLKRKISRKAKYQPSLVATELKLKVKGVPSMESLTGLEIRRIPI